MSRQWRFIYADLTSFCISEDTERHKVSCLDTAIFQFVQHAPATSLLKACLQAGYTWQPKQIRACNAVASVQRIAG